MNDILIISKSRKFFSTKEIIKSLKKLDASPRYVQTDRIRVCAEHNTASLKYRQRDIEDVGSIIPRIGRSLTNFGYILIRHFETKSIPSTLSSIGLIHGRNKFLALQELIGSGIPFPSTWLSASRMNTGAIKEKVNFPIIIKLLSGTQGIGVMRVNNEKDAIPIVDTLNELNQLILIQKYLKNNGEDIRAFVVDGRVVAAMKRISPENDWRANIHAGGKGVAYDLTEEEEEIALKSTEVLGTGIAGVDLIQTPEGPQLIEVNVSPGFRGLLAATGINAADAIAEYGVNLAKS
jgi:ribosomal protein S6--L-glutamate ligase